MKIRPAAAELFHANRQAGRQTDMTKLIVAFRNFAKRLRMQCYAVDPTVYLCTDVQHARLASGCKSELLWKDPVVAQSEALFWHLPAVTAAPTENLMQNKWSLHRYCIPTRIKFLLCVLGLWGKRTSGGYAL